jgi:hypothetical protein
MNKSLGEIKARADAIYSTLFTSPENQVGGIDDADPDNVARATAFAAVDAAASDAAKFNSSRVRDLRVRHGMGSNVAVYDMAHSLLECALGSSGSPARWIDAAFSAGKSSAGAAQELQRMAMGMAWRRRQVQFVGRAKRIVEESRMTERDVAKSLDIVALARCCGIMEQSDDEYPELREAMREEYEDRKGFLDDLFRVVDGMRAKMAASSGGSREERVPEKAQREDVGADIFSALGSMLPQSGSGALEKNLESLMASVVRTTVLHLSSSDGSSSSGTSDTAARIANWGRTVTLHLMDHTVSRVWNPLSGLFSILVNAPEFAAPAGGSVQVIAFMLVSALLKHVMLIVLARSVVALLEDAYRCGNGGQESDEPLKQRLDGIVERELVDDSTESHTSAKLVELAGNLVFPANDDSVSAQSKRVADCKSLVDYIVEWGPSKLANVPLAALYVFRDSIEDLADARDGNAEKALKMVKSVAKQRVAEELAGAAAADRKLLLESAPQTLHHGQYIGAEAGPESNQQNRDMSSNLDRINAGASAAMIDLAAAGASLGDVAQLGALGKLMPLMAPLALINRTRAEDYVVDLFKALGPQGVRQLLEAFNLNTNDGQRELNVKCAKSIHAWRVMQSKLSMLRPYDVFGYASESDRSMAIGSNVAAAASSAADGGYASLVDPELIRAQIHHSVTRLRTFVGFQCADLLDDDVRERVESKQKQQKQQLAIGASSEKALDDAVRAQNARRIAEEEQTASLLQSRVRYYLGGPAHIITPHVLFQLGNYLMQSKNEADFEARARRFDLDGEDADEAAQAETILQLLQFLVPDRSRADVALLKVRLFKILVRQARRVSLHVHESGCSAPAEKMLRDMTEDIDHGIVDILFDEDMLRLLGERYTRKNWNLVEHGTAARQALKILAESLARDGDGDSDSGGIFRPIREEDSDVDDEIGYDDDEFRITDDDIPESVQQLVDERGMNISSSIVEDLSIALENKIEELARLALRNSLARKMAAGALRATIRVVHVALLPKLLAKVVDVVRAVSDTDLEATRLLAPLLVEITPALLRKQNEVPRRQRRGRYAWMRAIRTDTAEVLLSTTELIDSEIAAGKHHRFEESRRANGKLKKLLATVLRKRMRVKPLDPFSGEALAVQAELTQVQAAGLAVMARNTIMALSELDAIVEDMPEEAYKIAQAAIAGGPDVLRKLPAIVSQLKGLTDMKKGMSAIEQSGADMYVDPVRQKQLLEEFIGATKAAYGSGADSDFLGAALSAPAPSGPTVLGVPAQQQQPAAAVRINASVSAPQSDSRYEEELREAHAALLYSPKAALIGQMLSEAAACDGVDDQQVQRIDSIIRSAAKDAKNMLRKR